MNDFIDCSWSKRILGPGCLLFLIGFGWSQAIPVHAQEPEPVVRAYSEYPAGVDPRHNVQQVQLPNSRQYYEYLPPRRGGDAYQETPLDRFLKQAARQTYGRFEYLNWAISDPSQGVIGGPGKRLEENVGFAKPAFIDGFRASDPDLLGDADLDGEVDYPIFFEKLSAIPDDLVLIQTWESNRLELDGLAYESLDDDGNGVIDPDEVERNDIDLFPRLTNDQKIDFLSGADPNTLVPVTSAADPDTIAASQVAVLAVGRLANSRAFQLDNNNGFRGVFGLNTTFGAMELSFFTLGRARSDFEFVPIPNSLTASVGTGGGVFASDPLVIPILVNGEVAPDIFDPDGNLVTDSNNFYLIFNDTYRARYTSEAWGISPEILMTLRERPDRYKLSSTIGVRYFDFREQMWQQGTFLQEPRDPHRPFYTYENELDGDLTSTIDSVTSNQVVGPTFGLRSEVGDERLSFGLDTKVMLGVNSYEAEVAVDDLLFEGDDNFSEISSTDFSAGFEMVVDAKIKLVEHVTLTAGYNFLWFSSITRPKDNIYYNVNATPTASPPPVGGPDFDFSNDVRVRKSDSTLSLSGLSVGLLIDW